MSKIEEFNAYRSKMNEQILDADNLLIKRIFNLDTNAFKDGEVDGGTKELVGLACSMVLRCDDCIQYHILRCVEAGYNKKQIFEIFAIANLIGGTIVIPHLRRATEFLNELIADSNE